MYLSILVALTCTYDYTVWNARERRSSSKQSVSKPHAEAERREHGCTPCREDQVEVRLSNGVHFEACRAVAGKFKDALENSLARGQEIRSVVGYRPQMSRGPLDAKGNRTQWSNHSFGLALDVNEAQNGLYENCERWSPRCRLRKGGAYDPASKLSLTPSNPLVAALKERGFHWGGEIPGRQKDFMHFSPTGF